MYIGIYTYICVYDISQLWLCYASFRGFKVFTLLLSMQLLLYVSTHPIQHFQTLWGPQSELQLHNTLLYKGRTKTLSLTSTTPKKKPWKHSLLLPHLALKCQLPPHLWLLLFYLFRNMSPSAQLQEPWWCQATHFPSVMVMSSCAFSAYALVSGTYVRFSEMNKMLFREFPLIRMLPSVHETESENVSCSAMSNSSQSYGL